MDDKIKLLNYGTRPMQDFPDCVDLLKTLSYGDVAYVKDRDTNHDYILTKELDCWTMIYDSELQNIPTKKHMEKVYNVEFMEYTNCMRDTVSNGAKKIGDMKFINVGKEPFLVAESELDKYREYGGGFRSITFVGNMER